MNRSSLTSSQPQSILKNTATGPSLKAINTSRSSPIQPSNKKKVYFQIEAKKDPLFLKNLKLQQSKLKLKALQSKKMILEKVFEKEKKDNELMLKNKLIYLEQMRTVQKNEQEILRSTLRKMKEEIARFRLPP